MQKVNDIVIVGGGSSGWMTAAALTQTFPELNITLIESPNTPTIGVGESTILSINEFMRTVNLKDKDWMPACKATYKVSIDFTNFDGQGTRFRYPFGHSTYLGKYQAIDWFVKKALTGVGDKTEYSDFALGHSQMIKANKLIGRDRNIPNWNFDTMTAYHFDATLFGHYLRDNRCEGLNHIRDDVLIVNKNEDGVSGLVTSSHGELKADLYIDCSGFKSMLLEEAMGVSFISFSEKLLNDKAVACHIPYVDKNVEMEHSTNATTLNAGWSWNIPLWESIGTGYVYSSQYLSEDEAEQEFREYLINDRDVPHSREEIENIEMHHVPMRPGIHDKGWVKNVCAVGLANGFIEPLESTGLMLTHHSIFALIEALQMRGCRINGFDKSIFNTKVKHMMSKFSGFIAGHYAFAERDDTPYWKEVTENIDYLRNGNSPLWNFLTRVAGDIATLNSWNDVTDIDGTPHIMAGMGMNVVTKHAMEEHYQEKLTDEHDDFGKSFELQSDIDKYVKEQSEYVKSLPTHYEFLRDNVYNE